jgi:hypothetical protein
MSTITNYATLQTAVANWLHRQDLAALVPDFISLAENEMSADIVARPMEARATLAVTAGNAYVTLPSDVLEFRRLLLVTDPVSVLRYESPDQISTDYPTEMVGKPTLYTVIGSTAQLAPIPDSNYSLEITYRQSIPSLSVSNPTNWLLINFPNVYLYGALCAAQPYLMDDSRIGLFKNLYAEAVSKINSIDWCSATTMRVRAR